MTKYIKLSISIPLQGCLLKEINFLINELEKKFNLTFIKKKNCRLHINLFSGVTCHYEKIKKIFLTNKKNIKKNLIYTKGFGIFLSNYPTIYIRFKHNSNFTKIRKILFNNSKLWKKIDNNILNQEWLPKASIVHKDLNLSKLSTVSKFIIKKKLSKKMLLNEIIFLNFTKAEKEIDTIKL